MTVHQIYPYLEMRKKQHHNGIWFLSAQAAAAPDSKIKNWIISTKQLIKLGKRMHKYLTGISLVKKVIKKVKDSLYYRYLFQQIKYQSKSTFLKTSPTNIYLLKGNNRDTINRCEIGLKLKIKILRTMSMT